MVKVDEVISVIRRGPAEVKFDKKELENVISYLDILALDAELDRVAPFMQEVGEDGRNPGSFIGLLRTKQCRMMLPPVSS